MVRTQVAYLEAEWKLRPDRPRIDTRETRLAVTSPVDVEVHDARPAQRTGMLDLDTNGFVLAQHESAVTDFRDRDRIRDTYVPEMSELLSSLTGADDVFWFPFAPLRNEAPDDFFAAYSQYMHCDYAPLAADRLTTDLLRRANSPLADDHAGWDFAWFNLWRPVDWQVEMRPLTIVDASTVDPSDIVEYRPAPDALASLPVHEDQHRLSYFPAMQTNEVAIFKQLDSRPDRAMVCPHTSFVDPDSPIDARPRRSFEIRLVCAFAPTS